MIVRTYNARISETFLVKYRGLAPLNRGKETRKVYYK